MLYDIRIEETRVCTYTIDAASSDEAHRIASGLLNNETFERKVERDLARLGSDAEWDVDVEESCELKPTLTETQIARLGVGTRQRRKP